MDKTVVALYDELSQARAVVQELVDAGFDRNRISLVANASAREYERYFDREGRYQPDLVEEPMETEAGEGAGIGAIVGGLGGVLMGFGLLAIPGVGPALAAGPILAGLLGAGAGAVVGGLVGALVRSGVPEEAAGHYAEAVRRGGSLISLVTDESRVSEAEVIMNRHHPIDLEERIASWRDVGYTEHSTEAEPFDAAMIAAERERLRARPERMRESPETTREERTGETVIPVVEEEIAVGKREVHRGGVRIHTYVREEPVDADVTLRDEELHVERRPADRDLSGVDRPFEERTIELTETDEEPVIAKRARVTEEVIIGKDVHERTERVQDTVRHTEVEVENLSDEFGRDYREHYSAAFGTTGRRYEEFEPAYRFGSDLARERAGGSKSWAKVEQMARRNWEATHPGTWDEFKDAIHYSFDRENANA
jgi:uncharacterized protein (TIGR02271 family)